MSNQLTDVTQAIVELAEANPELSNAEIAEQVGTRIPTVRDVRAAEGLEQAVEAAGTGTGGESAVGSSTDVQQAIVEAAEANPGLTNAEIAEQVGTRIPTVRDVRAAEGLEQAAQAAVADTADESVETELTDGQQSILELAAAEPALTNAEIADRLGARIATVRDVRATHDSPQAEGAAGGSSTDVQQAIVEAAEANPELSNAEIAEEVGARIPTVRDVRAAEGIEQPAGATGTGGDDAPTADDLTEVQQAILEAAEANPKLRNAAIAEQVGARIPTVRDVRAAHDV